MTTNVFELFNNTLSTSKEIPFSDQWPNGTGYLDGIVGDEGLLETLTKDGDMAKAVDPHGRNILIVRKDYVKEDGTVVPTTNVVFIRTVGRQTLVRNVDRKVELCLNLESRVVTPDDLNALLTVQLTEPNWVTKVGEVTLQRVEEMSRDGHTPSPIDKFWARDYAADTEIGKKILSYFN